MGQPRGCEFVDATKGRGMHVLGFVPVGGLRTTPLRPIGGKQKEKEKNIHTSKAADTESVVRGPSSWKAGRAVFEHGNYSKYYRYRHNDGQTGTCDFRLNAVADRLGPDVFANQRVLDIGCNAGLVSIEIARCFGASYVVGMDIDPDLIEQAKANRKTHFPITKQTDGDAVTGTGKIKFRAEDILSSPLRREPDTEPEQFDIVTCLSVTKWIHFVHGDHGIRRLFKRVFKRVQPGGLFILEPQEWSSYKKKRHITPEIRQTVAGIEMRPEGFDDCLTEIGFNHIGTIEPPSDGPANFRRSIRLFRRPDVADETEEAVATVEPSKKRKASKNNNTEAAGIVPEKRQKLCDEYSNPASAM